MTLYDPILSKKFYACVTFLFINLSCNLSSLRYSLIEMDCFSLTAIL
jgi:hypothetical protein